MIDELIALLRALARDNLSQQEMEALRQKIFILMSQGREAVNLLNNAGVSTGLNADFLDGQHGEYYRNADNINAGTLNTERFSAYADLIAENKIGVSNTQVAAGDHTHGGVGNANDIHLIMDGVLTESQEVFSVVVPRASEIEKVYLHCRNTGTSGNTIIDVNRNGTTIFSTQSNRPTLAYNDSDRVISAIPDIQELSEGDVLSVDIDEAAAGAEGLSLVIRLVDPATSVTRKSQLFFTFYDVLAVGSIPARYYNRTGVSRIIQQVHLYCMTPPQGADIVVDIFMDGSSIFADPAHRPKVTSGNNTGYSTQIGTVNWAHDSYLTCMLVQTGSIYPGSDLVISVVYF